VTNTYCLRDLNSPPVTKVGKAVGEFVLWPSEFLQKTA
jgi:hypothetical protein